MNSETEKQILDELRVQTVLFKKTMLANKVAIFILGVFILVFFVSIPFRYQLLTSSQPTPQSVDSWQRATDLSDRGNYKESANMTQRLINKYPDYYYGYALMGCLQQQIGSLQDAESNYAKAYDLFPSEDNEKTLVAIRKVLEKKKTSANKASEAIGAQGAPQPQR